MKLFGSYTSPYVRHCRIVLDNNQMDFELVDTDYQASAENSPTSRVPFLHDVVSGEDVKLHDSSSITHYLRDKQQQEFLSTPFETEVYALANTVLDTMINLFFLKKSGVNYQDDYKDNTYLQRHHQRALDSLAMLDKLFSSIEEIEIEPLNDANIRVACMLDWCDFRKRADISQYPNLVAFLDVMNGWDSFAKTSPALSNAS